MTDPNQLLSEPALANQHQYHSLDDTIEHCIGDFGWRQFFESSILSIAWFFDSQQTFISVFTDAEPKWSCNNFLCNNNNMCGLPKDSWSWDLPAHASIISEWSLECASPIIRGLPVSSFFLGCFVGGFVLATLADSFLGRKKTLVLSCLLMSLPGLLNAAVSTNIWMYSGLRFISGLGRSIVGTCALVLSTELVGKKWRGSVGICGFILFTLGFLSLPGIAFLLRGSSWRFIYLCTCFPPVFYSILVYFFVHESPRWLFVKGRKQEFTETLRSLANSPETRSSFGDHIEWADQKSQEHHDIYSALNILLKKRWAFQRLVATMVAGFGMSMIYYGMPYGLGNLSFNLYLSVALNAISEFPASLLAFFLVAKVNRKGSLLGLALLSGICSMACVLVRKKGMQNALELVSFSSACTAFDVLMIYTLELFPTCVRNSAATMVRQVGLLAGVLSSMLVAASRKNRWLSYGVFGVTTLICGLFVLLLPETRGRTMCDTVEEEEGESREVHNGV
ncbi:hypothetical protein BUALT_BualtUnG0006700 [Buddleja alternifolia]|uniref:Major facilitator superfamily (MFS) profile domain-containing protein n=1 Tax=Buddleja alternifolia TaxID=168488 RepID=A0AAV6W7S7_9LAMI|nr:hypothetical protein BUALT_BualtUnG0006700 [Buddleja alternifolia]